MRDKSGIDIISLPQGGGTLKGVDETFSPDPFAGTGNFSLPIDLFPGRNGLQTRLTLVYSAGDGGVPIIFTLVTESPRSLAKSTLCPRVVVK